MKKYSWLASLSLLALGCVNAQTGTEGFDTVNAELSAEAAESAQHNLTSAQVSQLVANYYIAVRGLNLNNYLANFAKHGSLEDPAGTPPNKGLAAIGATYQQAVDGFTVLDMREIDVFTPNLTNEAAVRWTATLTFKNGLKVDAFNGISHIKYNDAGKISSLRAFWDPSVMAGAHY